MKCRTIKGLVRALKAKKIATLEVWDIMSSDLDQYGVYLNLGNNKYAYVGASTWQRIQNHLVSPEGRYCHAMSRYAFYFSHSVITEVC